ncbi:MAG: SIS domain-containing protein [Planctomycetota bacterium]|jgi:D-sedoheptulose 7-phosphate isomerase
MNNHLQTVAQLLETINGDLLQAAKSIIQQTHSNGGTVFVAGNGGSCATAAHFVNDLIKAGVRAHALGQNSAVLTAQANDEGFENALVNELKAVVKGSSNCLVTMSVSGSSPNILRCISYAKSLQGFHVIQLTGLISYSGTDVVLAVPSSGLVSQEYESVEDVHSVICHAIAKRVRDGS